MYEAFYGFREKPFNLTPDPRFLYLSTKHSEAFAHLEFGLKQRGGFVVVTGEVGTGKTTLCRYFLERLDETTSSAFILYPALSAVELLKSICGDLGVAGDGATAKELVDTLHRFLLEARASGKNIVLVIDEAQNLAAEVLEQIRLISNLETSTEKLIQVVLIGQSELGALLSQPGLRQLAQRVTARYHLKPLSGEESTHYIRHRLNVAGGAGKVSFTPGALRAIHRFTNGIPRLINLVCDRALLAGFVLNRREIDKTIIRRSVNELSTVHGRAPSWHRFWKASGAAAALVLAALAVSFAPEVRRWLPWGGKKIPDTAEGVPSSDVRPAETGPPIVASPPTPATAPPPASTEDFEMRLQTLSRELSRRGAASVALELWGVDMRAGVGAFSADEELIAIGRRARLEVTELMTHMEQLRRLNVPVVLELFHTSRSDTCFSALTRLDGETAVVSFSPGDVMRVPVSTLDRFWVRRAFVFWRDFENLGPVGSEDARTAAWVRDRLQRLGFLSAGEAESPSELRRGVARFQSFSLLAPDGIAGPRTRMALYSLSGGYPVPRLFQP